MNQDFWLEVKNRFLNFITQIGPNILYALVALVFGVLAIKFIMRLLKRVLRKSNVELSLKTFIESLSFFILYGLLFTLIGSILGVKATSFLAIFGAAGIAVGLALQGSLSNFAGGVLILVFKPFKVGDLISVRTNVGFVIKIDILYTRIKTFDGRIIIMPNGNVSNSDVDNRTMEETRRIDLSLKFNYDADIDDIRKIIVEALEKHPKILKTPRPDVWLDSIGEYEMKITARSWVNSNEYWPVYWEQLEAVKKSLDNHGIEIPIPRRLVFQGGESKPNSNKSVSDQPIK
jgi:small conductance mechanosensitive channel